MACCGNKRSSWAQASVQPVSGPVYAQNGKKMWPDILFEYIGSTALSVTGTITGATYRFAGQGSVLVIDYRDAAGMMGIPVLRKQKATE